MSQKRSTTTRKKSVITKFPSSMLKIKYSAQKSKHGTDLKDPLYNSKKKPIIKFSSKIIKGGKSKKVLHLWTFKTPIF